MLPTMVPTLAPTKALCGHCESRHCNLWSIPEFDRTWCNTSGLDSQVIMSKGTGELLVKGESVGPARYDIQSVVRGGKRFDDGWVYASIDVIEKCFGSHEVSLRLANDKVVKVTVGSHDIVDPTEVRAQLILHESV